eukprot:TRINITY_DN15546_c0_g1_i1.p1 TRINITY_DN15546_c0_g1~~TRINITY_DN15546_c0_g1_i1.p1  ORF type:complete len:321 (+),score=86.02 TRINITY_DN15546_c0_g1_i1:61-1023(+)
MGKRGGGGGGGGDGKKSKKQYMPGRPEHSQGELQPGQRGLLFAHDPFKEKEAKAEIRHLVSKYATDAEPEPAQAPGAGSVAAALAAELAEAGTKKQEMGKLVDTGCRGQLLLKLPGDGLTGEQVAQRIASGIMRAGCAETRFLSRMLPVAAVTKADAEKISADFGPVIEKWLAEHPRTSEGPRTYAVFVDHKNSPGGDNYGGTGVPREKLISRIAALMPTAEAVADLKEPEIALFCFVIKSMACLGVASRFSELQRLNIRTLGRQEHKSRQKPAKRAAEDPEPAAKRPRVEKGSGLKELAAGDQPRPYLDVLVKSMQPAE